MRGDIRVTEGVTVLEVVTDGMLILELMKDPMLSEYITVVLDEVHERTINTDLAMAQLRLVSLSCPHRLGADWSSWLMAANDPTFEWYSCLQQQIWIDSPTTFRHLLRPWSNSSRWLLPGRFISYLDLLPTIDCQPVRGLLGLLSSDLIGKTSWFSYQVKEKPMR